jgi:hypothetical protein
MDTKARGQLGHDLVFFQDGQDSLGFESGRV